jgi:hypothetical protein
MVTSNWRFLDDRQSREALVATMAKPLRDEYLSYKFVKKEAGFPGRVLIVYTLKGGGPHDIDRVALMNMGMDQAGPVIYASSEGQGVYHIGPVPMKWRGREVFFQVPQTFDLKWRGKSSESRVEFQPLYAVLVKTRGRVDEQVEGHTYCETLNEFRARFPGVPMRY